MAIKKRPFKSDVRTALEKVAQKHGVEIKLKKMEGKDGHFESVMVIDETIKEKAKNVNEGPTRREQVAELLKQGVDSPKEIAERLGTHPSYISRLKHELQEQEAEVA